MRRIGLDPDDDHDEDGMPVGGEDPEFAGRDEPVLPRAERGRLTLDRAEAGFGHAGASVRTISVYTSPYLVRARNRAGIAEAVLGVLVQLSSPIADHRPCHRAHLHRP
ncbi:hypothetical protein [Embleya sp. MST-111070]|uniref:hypothetical protein n=1 Tax=Embleya sp. MST-111070 TaxID=3398231 RepID=UPI003F73E3B2